MVEIAALGVKPAGMKNIVRMPHAIRAGMFGMIMPDRKVPNFCTATRAPPLAGAEVVELMCGFLSLVGPVVSASSRPAKVVQ